MKLLFLHLIDVFTSRFSIMMLPAASINDTDSPSLILPDQTSQRFTLAEIQSATNNFDEKQVIGSGGFGKVYKCSLTIGSVVTEVAIKRLDSTSDQGATEFEAEVKLLSKLRHGNLVSLIGYCNEGKEMVLVYEFMPNGTLKDHLRVANCALTWLQRLKICIGAARALDYLHTGTSTQQGVIHRDVKTSNILLDANLAAKVSDFGLAKIGPTDQTRTDVSTRVKGTHGYMDLCYFFSGKLTRKSDVYAFGVVLFEALSGKQAVDSTLDEDQWSLAAWVQDQIKEGKLNKIIDPRLMGQISKRCLKEFAGIAGQCLHTQPKQRPTMAEVVVKLESILSHEREFTNSFSNEGGFIYKIRDFFTVKEDSKSEVNAPHMLKSNNGSLRIFKFAELVSATNNFEDKEDSLAIHETIYKGWVDEKTYTPTECGVGLAMYVTKKKFFKSKLNLKPEEFNHPNLVKLLGYCLKRNKLFRVYELIPDASLDKLLFGEQGGSFLSWVSRLKIASGAAQGLAFLHQRHYPAYCLLKTSCILVDKDFNARLSGFEVDRSSVYYASCFYGNADISFAAPEWLTHRAELHGVSLLLSYGFDVTSEIYSFGVVLLEILTGRKQDLRTDLDIPLRAEKIKLDPQLLRNNRPPKAAFKLAVLVSNCLQPSKKDRPSMEEILQVLYECYEKEIQSI